MKKIKLLLLIIVVSIATKQLNAQTANRCGTMEHHQWLMQTRPGYAQAYQQNESAIQQWIANHQGYKMSSVPDTIPIVVHVVYKTAIQNISNAQVMSQIDVLNEDWGRTNADTVNTPAVWQPIS